MSIHGKHNDTGFTLFEVLIALAILAAGAALTLSLISGSLGNIRKVQVRTRIIEHAETVMELSLLDDAIRRPTTLQGDFEDGTRWTVTIDEFEPPSDVDVAAQQLQQRFQQQFKLPVEPFSYTVEVFGPNSRVPDYRIQTLKLVNTFEPGNPVRVTR